MDASSFFVLDVRKDEDQSLSPVNEQLKYHRSFPHVFSIFLRLIHVRIKGRPREEYWTSQLSPKVLSATPQLRFGTRVGLMLSLHREYEKKKNYFDIYAKMNDDLAGFARVLSIDSNAPTCIGHTNTINKLVGSPLSLFWQASFISPTPLLGPTFVLVGPSKEQKNRQIA
ncbi:hypothetical protein L2E82_27693 [Cichorium intybus]|uniref:Uncharacterized protein n=1 Tax=Cichorium intybus TaxID=13427 RepID=A0ACB9CU16_CICIN|nr:hypothetical protein L2E82_27693 [Cichorium intybus]